MPHAATDDRVVLSYRVRGQGPPDLLLHGWAGSGAYFDQLLACLDLAHLRAVTFDYRGHGDSDKPDHGYTLGRLAADALTIADDAGAHQFVVVGFSMSGKFAQYLACVAPQRVRGQILVAGCPAAELRLPADLLDDWYSRAGSAERMIDLVRDVSTRPIQLEPLQRFGRDAAKVPLTALKER